MTQGVIAEWCKKEGEVIKAGDAYAKVETDKATVDFESTDDAIMGKILVPVGEAQVGRVIAVLVDDAAAAEVLKGMTVEQVLAELGGGSAAASAAQPAAAAAPAAAAPAAAAPAAAAAAASAPRAATASSAPSSSSGRVAVTPYARKVRALALHRYPPLAPPSFAPPPNPVPHTHARARTNPPPLAARHAACA